MTIAATVGSEWAFTGCVRRWWGLVAVPAGRSALLMGRLTLVMELVSSSGSAATGSTAPGQLVRAGSAWRRWNAVASCPAQAQSLESRRIVWRACRAIRPDW